IESLSNSSVRDAEKMLAIQFPEVQAPREKIKPVSEEFTKYEFTANQRLHGKLQKLKNLLAHKNYDGRLDCLIEILADMALEKLSPETKSVTKKPPQQKAKQSLEPQSNVSTATRPVSNGKPFLNVSSGVNSKPSRYISVNSKKLIWKKAQARCEY